MAATNGSYKWQLQMDSADQHHHRHPDGHDRLIHRADLAARHLPRHPHEPAHHVQHQLSAVDADELCGRHRGAGGVLRPDRRYVRPVPGTAGDYYRARLLPRPDLRAVPPRAVRRLHLRSRHVPGRRRGLLAARRRRPGRERRSRAARTRRERGPADRASRRGGAHLGPGNDPQGGRVTAADPALPGTGPVTEAAADIQVTAVTAPADVRLTSAKPAEANATVTLVLVAAAGLMVSLSLSLLVPVLPRLAAELHTSATSAEWLLTATLLTGAVAVPVLGRLGDLYGKKRILVVSLVTFLAGSLICAFTSDIGVMIAGRAVAGLSVAAIPLGISLVGTVLPASRAGHGIALISAMLGVGSALGLPLAGVIAEHADYHVLFWICVAGGAVTLTGTIALVPEQPAAGHGKFDLPGALLLAVALTALLLPLSQGSVWGWTNVKTAALLAASVVL